MTQIGLIIGSGTGRELGNVFKQCVYRIAHILEREVEVVECTYEFKSYNALRNLDYKDIKQHIEQELNFLMHFYRNFYHSGGRAIFKTAINAETLYKFRRLGKAVKVVPILVPGMEKQILMVRDQMQGFYVNDECNLEGDKLHFTGSLTKDNLELIITFALTETKLILRNPFDVWIIYKHHLFANLIETWARSIHKEVHIYQPNHATELLFRYFREGDKDLLIITGNEVGDILHEVLMFHLGLGTRNTLYSKNVYLQDELRGLIEYQTVHGSADDVAGKGVVNPFATLRATGALLEDCLHEKGFTTTMENALKQAEKERIVTPDMGGNSTIFEVTEYVLSQFEKLLKGDIVHGTGKI